MSDSRITMTTAWEYKSCEKEVMVMQIIKTMLLRRGDGKETPIRAVTQYWSMDGDLLAEHDPCAGQVVVPDSADAQR